jgi:hypothetical protein
MIGEAIDGLLADGRVDASFDIEGEQFARGFDLVGCHGHPDTQRP